MDNISTAMLIVSSEIGLVVIIIFAIIFTIYTRRRLKDSKTSHKLIEQFKSDLPARKTSIENYVKKNLDIPEEKIKPLLDNIIDREKSLYSHVLKIFSGRDREAIRQLNNDIEALTEAYQNFASYNQNSSIEADAPKSDTDSSDELIVLKAENTRLHEELKISMESVSRLQREYQNLYDRNTVSASGSEESKESKESKESEELEPPEESKESEELEPPEEPTDS